MFEEKTSNSSQKQIGLLVYLEKLLKRFKKHEVDCPFQRWI